MGLSSSPRNLLNEMPPRYVPGLIRILVPGFAFCAARINPARVRTVMSSADATAVTVNMQVNNNNLAIAGILVAAQLQCVVADFLASGDCTR